MKAPKQTTGNIVDARKWNSLRADAAAGANLLAHQQEGAYTLPTNASNNQTLVLTINGTAITATLVTGTPTNPNDIKIGASGTATAVNIQAWIQNPKITNSNQVAASAANQQLLSYINAALPLNSTTLTIYSLNNVTDAPLTSFSGSTTITGGAYATSTMRLYIEPATFYIGTTQVAFTGTASGLFVAPVSNPRIDLLCIGTASAITITQGSEAASPSAPTYPTDKVVICEVYNRVGETKILDNENQGTAHGYILKDARPFTTIMYINDPLQIQDGVITQAKLANAGTVPTGTVISAGIPTGTAIAGWLECTGTAVSRTTYATLFATIGTAFGSGNGSTTFNVPDLRGRVAVGAGTGAGDKGSGTGTPTGTALSARTVGQWAGEEKHLLVTAEMPSHTHSGVVHQGSGVGATGGPNILTTDTSTGSTGGDTEHQNMVPFLVLTVWIKT